MTDPAGPRPARVHLRADGVSVLLDTTGSGLPRVLHWGADLGEGADEPDRFPDTLWAPPVPRGALDVPVPLALLPEPWRGWRGRPGLRGHRGGGGTGGDGTDADDTDRDDTDGGDRRTADMTGAAWSPAFTVHAVEQAPPNAVVVSARDDRAGLALRSELHLEPDGLLRMRHVLTNTGTSAYDLGWLSCVLPVPPQAGELLDLTGRWCRERHPQRHGFTAQGVWVREGRHGRTGHDAPLVLVAGSPGFGFRSGEVWGVHLGWSGDWTCYAERVGDGRAVLGVGELLGPGEVSLASGEEYVTPPLYASYSGAGLDGLSRRFHRFLRARPEHPRSPRPVILNTWEAVYFRHDLAELTTLAETAAGLGVERFVLDDGWFRHRRDDTAGLGDWYVDEDVWPEGLAPLADRVRELGMQFGLWVEPEMVNPDSDLYRAHPDWVLSMRGRTPPPWRSQQVLDLANPDAWGYLLERLDALLRDVDVDYLKWDHNRDLVDPGHEGRHDVHSQTLALYRLVDELRARHPGVEIESCASGGGRVDLGILERTDRVWASDTNDPLERQGIQRWTGLLLPPELVGAHIGPPVAHTTGRSSTLAFRAATAVFGHLGIEWDVRRASAEEGQALAAAVAAYKRHRDLICSGDVVRADHPDPAALVHGVVARDGSQALFAYVQLATSTAELPAPARLPGLAPERTYRVTVEQALGPAVALERTPPPWTALGLEADGRALSLVGVPMPVLVPEQALVLHAVAV